jgi:hypothetical protein
MTKKKCITTDGVPFAEEIVFVVMGPDKRTQIGEGEVEVQTTRKSQQLCRGVRWKQREESPPVAVSSLMEYLVCAQEWIGGGGLKRLRLTW